MADSSRLPTQSAEALRSFVDGRERFQSYWGSQSIQDLQRAKQQFEYAEQADPAFALASFYVAVTDNELRRHDPAIGRLQSLVERRVDFLPEAYVHLAYAHAKKYTEEDYESAERALESAAMEARKRGRLTFLPVIESYRVFLYSLIGGRSKRPHRERYLNKAIRRGRTLLFLMAVLHLESRLGILIEVHNALGIAYMRQGELAQEGATQTNLWSRSDDQYKRALQLSPNVVRVLQNRGTLRQLQGDAAAEAGEAAAATMHYRQALEIYRRTLSINPHDQFPHYRAAVLCAKLGEWEAAKQYYESGVGQPGSVKSKSWQHLRNAIEARDPSQLA